MYMKVDADGLPWLWTPVLSGVGLAPNASVEVRLRTARPCPDAFVVLLTERQLEAAAPMLMRGGIGSTYMPCAWRASLAAVVNATHQVRTPQAERYFLGVVQAVPGAAEGLTGEVGFVNPGGCQLPVQQRNTPIVWLVLAIAFSASLALISCVSTARPKGRTRLHALLLAAVAMKCVVLMLIRVDVQALSTSGRPVLVRQILWQLLRQTQLVLEVLVFYAIGLGWKVVRPYLRPAEWGFAGAVAFFSMALGSLEVGCSALGTCASQSFLLAQFTLHSLCFLVVIVATNFNIFTLQRHISEALANPETSALYAKHRAYCHFRFLFLLFVIVPTVTNFLALHVVRWDQLWVIILVREGSLWAIYTCLLWLFRPGLDHLRVFEMAVVDVSEGGSEDDGEA